MPRVYKDESGKIIEVKLDEVITDPNSELAVQIPPEADGRNDNPMGMLLDPSPLELLAAHEAAEAKASKSE